MVKVTIPVDKNINKEQGAIVLRVSDFSEKNNMHLIDLGKYYLELTSTKETNTVYIKKENSVLGEVEVHVKDIDIVISWAENTLWFNVFTNELIPYYIGSSLVFEVESIFEDKLSLFEKTFFNGVYEKIEIYSDSLNQTDIGSFSLEIFKEVTDLLFKADFSTPTHYQKNVVIEDTFAPRDGSPILLEDDKGPLYRQFLFDERTSKYQNHVVETFTYMGEKKRTLAYKNIESTYKITMEFNHEPEKIEYYLGEELSLSGQTLYFDFTQAMNNLHYGQEYTVTYQLARSYNIEFNDDVPHDGFKVNLVNIKPEKNGKGHYSSTENISMIREGNRFEQEYLAKEIELNPLINPQVQGFMYIDKAEQETNAFRISASSQYVTGNGIDTASIMVEAIDSEGNEVLSPYLSMYIMNDQGETTSEFGTIEPIIGYNSMKARNTSGRAYYEFVAPILTEEREGTHKVIILAYDRKNKLSAQYPIYVRAVKENSVFPVKEKESNSLNVPFEYFARLYEKELKSNSPMKQFDKNLNNKLDRKDLESFIKDSKDRELMEALTVQLIELEEN